MQVRLFSFIIILLFVYVGCESIATPPSLLPQEIVTTLTTPPVDAVAGQGLPNSGRFQPLDSEALVRSIGLFPYRRQGFTGQGIRIGVIDTGFGNIFNFEILANRRITVPLMNNGESSIVELQADENTHGTDVLFVAHSIAPDSDYYACRYITYEEFSFCVDWMMSQNVHIINHSVGVPALPLNGRNRWAQEVDRAARQGILWVNAAGNFGSSHINEFFTDTNGDTYHEFRGPGRIDSLILEPVGDIEGRILLSWEVVPPSSTLPANAIDLDLEVRDTFNNIVAISSQVQSGNPSHNALEIARVTLNQTLHVRVRNVDGNTSNVRIVLFAEFVSVSSAEGIGSIIAPADSVNALTVGALQGNQIAPYSSRGPLSDGTLKPDVVAPGEVYLPDGRMFVGTSVAAPVVAGIAAIVWSRNPSWIREQVYSWVRGATDNPTPNVITGYGKVFLPAPHIGDIEPTATVDLFVVDQSPTSTTIPISPPTAIPRTQQPVERCGFMLRRPLYALGQTVVVAEDGLRLRRNYDESGAINAVAQVYIGTQLTLIDGPVCYNRNWYWKVRYQDLVGWMREAEGGDPYICPLENQNCSD